MCFLRQGRLLPSLKAICKIQKPASAGLDVHPNPALWRYGATRHPECGWSWWPAPVAFPRKSSHFWYMCLSWVCQPQVVHLYCRLQDSSLTCTLSFCICLTLSHRSEPSVSSLDYSSATLVVKDLVLHLQALLAAVEGGHAPGLFVSINVLSKSRQRPSLLWCRLPSSGFCSQILCDREVQPEVDYDGEEQDVEGHHPQQMFHGMSILLKI